MQLKKVTDTLRPNWLSLHPVHTMEIAFGNRILISSSCHVSNVGLTLLAKVCLPALADPGGPWGLGPPCPQDFFKIMQFSGNFKGKKPLF